MFWNGFWAARFAPAERRVVRFFVEQFPPSFAAALELVPIEVTETLSAHTLIRIKNPYEYSLNSSL
jgi:hypothetical protein